MKKTLLNLFLLTCVTSMNAQVLFYEDFDGISGPTAGGAGTYTFPSGWFLRNVDNKTPDGSVSYVNDAWERREDFSFNVADSAAFSTSWYSPAGAADDWMWTPLIGPLPANTVLTWNAVAYDVSFADGYEVRIMTSSQGPPTGGTGTLGNQVTNSTQVFSIASENSAWTSRNVSLSAYAGQSVYIAFRNQSNDKFLLLIDDVKVESVVNYDASVSTVTSLSRYSKIPLNQNPIFPLSATINNLGTQAVTNVTLNANVYNGANALVYTAASTPMASLAAGANAVFTTTSPFAPSVIDSFRVDYFVTIAETDQVPANDLKMDSIDITDTVYARDIGAPTGQLGIGAGNGGNLGNQFVITDTTQLSSVSIFFNSNYSTWKVGMDIFNYNNGAPTTLLYSSPADTIVGPFAGWHLFMLPANTVLLPDTYVVAAREIDSTLTVGQTTDKFTNGTVWVNWPTTPFGGWANVEAFGGGFAKPLMIRANLVDKCSGLVANVMSLNGTLICAGSADTLVASGGMSYLWDGSVGTDTLFVSPSATQTFTLTAVNLYSCYDTATVTVAVNALPGITATSSAGDTICSGNSTTLDGAGGVSYVWTGGVTDGVAFTPGGTQTYTVTGTDANGCSDTASITVMVDPCLGIDLLNTAAIISAYPNPNNGQFFVELKESMLITVYNSLGEIFVNAKYPQGRNVLSISHLSSGIYFVKAVAGEKQQVIKIIKEK